MPTRVERINHRAKRATTTLVLEADNASFRATGEGGLVLELFRYGAKGEALESYAFHLSPEDATRLGPQVTRVLRRDAADA